ncbi:hypothetical protein GCM10011389_15720 [Pontibacillus salipaludis]|uniref:Uncharacterized protein n=1 Tax=Pontibacillus salipaludis TaxID=1697394 RepID=A0ABQ1Q0I9_9BACI|nr:hypothetical protein GCM10011389_15720 [Pontibacillus salipaludis]
MGENNRYNKFVHKTLHNLILPPYYIHYFIKKGHKKATIQKDGSFEDKL